MHACVIHPRFFVRLIPVCHPTPAPTSHRLATRRWVLGNSCFCHRLPLWQLVLRYHWWRRQHSQPAARNLRLRHWMTCQSQRAPRCHRRPAHTNRRHALLGALTPVELLRRGHRQVGDSLRLLSSSHRRTLLRLPRLCRLVWYLPNSPCLRSSSGPFVPLPFFGEESISRGSAPHVAPR